MMKAFHPMRSLTADFAIYLCLLPQNPEKQKAKSMVEDHNLNHSVRDPYFSFPLLSRNTNSR